MKQLILIFGFITLNSCLFADVGKAYRYEATFKLQNNKELRGYFYYATYENKFDKDKDDFKQYILSNCHFPITLYQTIKTMKIDSVLTIDFAIEGCGISIDTNDIVSIHFLNEIEIYVGSRLREVNQNEYTLLNQKFISTENFNSEPFGISCLFYMLNWDEKNNLLELKNELIDKIKNLRKNNNEQSVIDYISRKRIELIAKQIVLFEYCGPI